MNVVIREGNRPNPVLIRDIFEEKSNDELIKEWEAQLSNRTDFALRDSLVEAMMHRGLRPETWITTRDKDYGLYPDISDPDFAARLLRKTEFASLSSKSSEEDTCTKSKAEFETTAVQRLVARFLHPLTPYRGILLNHGVGVGKTCSAVTVAEMFLEVLPQNVVYILAPQAIADGFERTIFDSNSLLPSTKTDFALTGERWKSSQCTGMTYPRLTGMAAAESKAEIEKEVKKLVNRRYKILGYRAFANWVKKKIDAIPATLTGVVREDKKKEILINLFSDHLIIIDEAHNLRDIEADSIIDETDKQKLTDSAEGKLLTPILRDIVKTAEGLRLMLMTATPMYDTAPEIVFLLNLLHLNDTKDESLMYKRNEIFTSDGRFTESGETKLVKLIKRYVSYMRGENPNTFPLRLTPPESGGSRFISTYPTISISRREGTVSMTDMDKRIMESLPLVVHTADEETRVGRSLRTILERNASPEGRGTGAIEISDFILDQTMQMGNFTYPNGLFGGDGWDSYFVNTPTIINGVKVSQYKWNPPEEETISIDSVLGSAGLRGFSPKIAGIVESLVKCRGMGFVYSRYVKSGAIPLAAALEMAGWCRVLADGTPAPLLARDPPVGGYKHYYVLLTSDDSLSPNFDGLIKYATTFTNMDEALHGKKVKAIIGSQITSEGLDLKCIREIHLIDGWYHLNRIEQIEGRGVRYCSHNLLPLEERNCLIYLHVINIPEYETADLYAYRLAVRKSQPIGRVSRLMKTNAWDCMLNRDAILLHDLPTRRIIDAQGRVTEKYDLHDKPYTSFCDFMDKCEYICTAREIPTDDIGKNESTYKEFDFRRKFALKSKILANLFGTEDVAIPLEQLKTTVYRDIPWSIAAIGLREVLGKLRILRSDGVYGTLMLQNGYVVFQPLNVTSTEIPLALRYGRAYGRLPRSIVPERGALFTTAVPERVAPPPVVEDEDGEAVAQPPAPPAAAPAAVNDRTTALASLRKWHTIVKQIISEPEGKLDNAGLPDDTFDGWRWIFNHFGNLKETIPIACKWWMDNMWTSEERADVFSNWTVRGLGKLDADEKMFAEQFQPRELFSGELSGYLVYNTGKSELQTFCFYDGDDVPYICPSISLGDVNDTIGPPIDRVKATGPIFGFLAVKAGNVVFKTVDKEKGDLKGAECSNTSNLKNHERRIKIIHDTFREFFDEEDEIRTLLLDDAPERKAVDKIRKARQDAVKRRFGKKIDVPDKSLDIIHTSDLSLRQICPYMEFLLRWMEMRRVGEKHWFLSIVESARAGVKMA